MNSVLTDLGNRTMFVEVFSEPGKRLLRGNRLRECTRHEENVDGKQISPQNSVSLDGRHSVVGADFELLSPRSQTPRSFSDSLTQQKHG